MSAHSPIVDEHFEVQSEHMRSSFVSVFAYLIYRLNVLNTSHSNSSKLTAIFRSFAFSVWNTLTLIGQWSVVAAIKLITKTH